MRPLAFILPIIAAPFALMAEPPSPQSVAAEVAANARRDALDKILSERKSPAAFEQALAAAREAGVSAQAMLEARFLYQVDKGDDAALASLLPELLKQRAVFNLDDSAIFSVEEEWLSVVEYVQSVAALVKGDKAGFKRHITEAFWLSPAQAAAYAPHIERFHMQESMAAVQIDLALRPAPLAGGDAVALGTLIKGKQALLLHFWSPWSSECSDAMPDFIATAASLSAHGVAVASLVPADMPGLPEDAAAMVQPHAGKACGAWLIDPKRGSLARQLRVRKLPTMVIVSTEGKVLFNGDAVDERFWETLHRIDARITRPASGGAQD